MEDKDENEDNERRRTKCRQQTATNAAGASCGGSKLWFLSERGEVAVQLEGSLKLG